MVKELTFNDLPQVVQQLVDIVTGLTNEITELKATVQKAAASGKNERRRPMRMEEVCEYLGITPSSFYYKVSHGALPAIKDGKRYYVYKDELEASLENNRKNGVAKSFEEENATMLASVRSRANVANHKKGGYDGE